MTGGPTRGSQPEAGLPDGAPRIWLPGMLRSVLAELDPGAAVQGAIGSSDGTLCIGSARIPVAGFDRGHVVAIGKAAGSMATAAMGSLGEIAGEGVRWRGVGVAPDVAGLPDLDGAFAWHAGDHPVPTSRSFAAAKAVLDFLDGVRAGEPVVFLISGGGSALCELPLPGVDEAELAEVHRRLVMGDGLARAPGILDANRIRRRLSAVKGGRLAAGLPVGSPCVTLLVSDVPVEHPEMVASGPTIPREARPAATPDPVAVARDCGLWEYLSPAARELLGPASPHPMPSPAAPVFAFEALDTILSERDAERAAAGWLEARSVQVEVVRHLDGAPLELGLERLLHQLDALRDRHPGRPVALVSTGELEVLTHGKVGRGGRNAHGALTCALRIEGQPVAFLSGATDGMDGNSGAAGGVVDGTTVARMRDAGVDPKAALRGFDAHGALVAVGDALTTGPTGTNVRDLRVLMALPE